MTLNPRASFGLYRIIVALQAIPPNTDKYRSLYTNIPNYIQ